MRLDRVRSEITSNSSGSFRPDASFETPSNGTNGGNSFATVPGVTNPTVDSLKEAIASVERVRRTTLVNQFLQYWMKWWGGLLIALLAVAAFAQSLRIALIAGAVLVALGAAVSVIVARMRRPSVYRAACLLDSAGGLQDRLSTAIYFAKSEDVDGMLLWQRQDALTRASRLNPAVLFPIRVPSIMKRVAVLALVAAAFLGYRVNHQPPVTRLVQKLAETRIAKTVITPELKAMEKDVAAALGLEEKNGFDKELRQTRQRDERQSGDADASASLKDVSADKSDLTNGNMDLQGENAEKSQDMSNQQQNPQSMPQQGEPTDGQPDSDNANQQQPGSSQSASQNQQAGQQSLSHTLMQALKDMVSKATGQQSGQSQGQNSPNAQQSPNQNASSNADSKSEAQKGSADANGNASKDSQQPGQATSDQTPQGDDGTEQAGNTPGGNRLQKNAALDSKTSPDKVDLNYSDPNGGARVRATAGPGTAQVPLTGASAAPVAAVNGAEQESIPQRYRMYVQHYFDHAATPQH